MRHRVRPRSSARLDGAGLSSQDDLTHLRLLLRPSRLCSSRGGLGLLRGSSGRLLGRHRRHVCLRGGCGQLGRLGHLGGGRCHLGLRIVGLFLRGRRGAQQPRQSLMTLLLCRFRRRQPLSVDHKELRGRSPAQERRRVEGPVNATVAGAHVKRRHPLSRVHSVERGSVIEQHLHGEG